MSMDSIDEERLQKLLGGAELANLRLRLRARYERGTSRDEFALTDLEACERRALAGLLGRRPRLTLLRLRVNDGPADRSRALLLFVPGALLRSEDASTQDSPGTGPRGDHP